MVSAHVRIGIEIADKNTVGVVLAPDGEILDQVDVSASEESYDARLVSVADIVASLEKRVGSGTASVGVALPGVILRTTGMLQNAQGTHLDGRPVRDDLTRLLRRLVRCMSSSACFAMSEAVDGAGTGTRALFAAILDDRCTGGVSFNNRRSLNGSSILPSAWAHNPLPWPREDEREATLDACCCGRSGCAESWLSTRAILRDFSSGNPSRCCDIDQFLHSFREGHPHAEAVFARYADRLARCLASIVNVVDLEVIVLGGKLSAIERLYSDVPSLMVPYLSGQMQETKVSPSAHGNISVARGAAKLWEI